MGRCHYDVIFYRVFCVTLLGVAFIFTVILTNVFVDIDGFFKESTKIKDNTPIFQTSKKMLITPIIDVPKSDLIYKEDDYGDEDEMNRPKRSLETPNLLFHINKPAMKNVLTNRLETLLEELDVEESTNIGAEEMKSSKEKIPNLIDNAKKENRGLDESFKNNEKLKKVETDNENNNIPKDTKNEDMLQLDMHQILLEAIIGHMNVNDIHKKNDNLYKKPDDFNKSKNLPLKQLSELVSNLILKKQQNLINQETTFFEELMKCKQLQKQVTQMFDEKKTIENKSSMTEKDEPEEKVLIKTVIDIKTQNDKTNHTNPKEVKGNIEVIYNGIPVILNSDNNKEVKNSIKTVLNEISEDESENIKRIKAFVNKVIEDYFKKHHLINKPLMFDSKTVKTERKLITKRTKRQVKIKYKLEPKNQTKENNTLKKNDDELYVEIETHFDSKGMKGEKKRKLVREIINKIRKAIRSGSPEINKTKKPKHIQVKKRIQNPLDVKHETLSTHEEAVPMEPLFHRRIESINNFIARAEDVRIRSKFGENWKQTYARPASLTVGSAQIGEVDVDYNKFMNYNAIPNRYQMPLNDDTSDETLNSNYFNVGNMKFIIKDLDGLGFSVGLNQYTDVAPDPEAINFFTGVENLVKAYHQNYDQAMPREHDKQNNDLNKNLEYMGKSEEPSNRSDKHTIIRRSAKEENLNSNELEFDFKHLQSQNQKKKTIIIINKDKTHNSLSSHKPSNIKQLSNDKSKLKILPSIFDDDIFHKHSKPKEIYGIASFFNRTKRTIAMKKYSNSISRKLKINKFLNTKKLATKRVFINKLRNKRHVDRFGVIALDDAHGRKQPEEQLFVLSDETLLADRATIREIETPEDLELIDHFNKKDPNYDLISIIDSRPDLPFAYVPPENPLMSKYPHLFMEEDSHRYDDLVPEIYRDLRTIPQLNSFNINHDKPQFIDDKNVETTGSLPMITTTEINFHAVASMPRVEEIVNAISPNYPKTKYKFTVKIIPSKNMTGLHNGFKEVHTSINKTFNNNGLMYSTLVNVSEVSKIDELFKERYKDTKLREMATTVKPIQVIEKIQSMIKNYKDRVDRQLDQLQKEKTRLESMMVKNDADSNNYTDIILPLVPPQKVHLKTSDVNKLVASALMTLQEEQKTQTPLITTERTTSVVTTSFTISSTTPQTTISPELRIKETIDKNDNLTKEILNKIDRNTEMLETVLVKLTNSIANLRRHANQTTTSNNREEWQINQPVQMYDKPREVNVTNDRIPFLYAYQQPYEVRFKDSLMASIMYKGHIHTNTIGKPSYSSEINNDNKLKAKNNSDKGRFFIDGIETGYLGISINNSSISDMKVNNND